MAFNGKLMLVSSSVYAHARVCVCVYVCMCVGGCDTRDSVINF